MPNHVTNELIFRGVDPAKQDKILAVVLNGKGEIDFEVLVPAPLNIWCGSVGQKHEKAFRHTHLDWATQNWGTKWNAYQQRPIERTGDTLTLRFDTAWRPPYGWIVALFNRFKLSFEHNWFDEGDSRGVSAKFDYARLDDLGGEPWSEHPADDAMQEHLCMLKYGVKSLDELDRAS